MPRRRYAIRLAYDGAPFRGWQRQPGQPTVQEAVVEGLAACGVAGPIAAAARTDAGVHALDQVVSLTVRAPVDPDRLRRDLNARLPPSILALDVREVPLSFHARASAGWRRYVYLVGTPAPEGLAPWAWSLPDPRAFPGLEDPSLDVGAMRAALSAAVGEHDFAGFARGRTERGSVKVIGRADVLEATGVPVVAVVLEGNGFLRAMARNLVGTAVAIGLGRSPPGELARILQARGRYRGVRAPGRGLTLAAVGYPPSAGLPARPS
jgi:tRNA pseudouridine38-40 synthase